MLNPEATVKIEDILHKKVLVKDWAGRPSKEVRYPAKVLSASGGKVRVRHLLFAPDARNAVRNVSIRQIVGLLPEPALPISEDVTSNEPALA